MRSVHRLTLAALATFGALAFSAAPALAGTVHGLTGAFGSGPCEVTPLEPCEGKFKEPAGVALSEVGATKGDVYVVDKGNNRVEYFSSTGHYEGQFSHSFSDPEAIAIDNDPSSPSKGDVYVTDTGHDVIDKFSPTGAYLNQITTGSGGAPFTGLLGVAVDPNGMVWVHEGTLEAEQGGEFDNYSDEEPNKFVASRIYEHGGEHGGDAEPGFAVDSADNLYVVHRLSRIVAKLDSAGVLLEPPGDELGGEGPKTGIAVDLSNNDAYLDNGSSVSAFAPNGSEIETFGSKALAANGGSGIAVSATGVVYVVDSAADHVYEFTEVPAAVAAPEAPLTEAVSVETGNTATLLGVLNPSTKERAGWYFAYNAGGSCTGGATTPVQPEAEVQAVAESKQVTGLEPEQQYTVCLVAENTFGPTYGAPETFTTPAAPPVVIAESTPEVKAFGATVETLVNPNKQYTFCEVEYGTDPTLTTNTTVYCETPAPGPQELPLFIFENVFSLGGLPASAHLQGLEADETYYYRVIPKNVSSEEGKGTIKSFTTIRTALASTGQAQSITRVTAALTGTIDPDERVPTTYHFVYIDQAGYEKALAGDAQEKANPYAEGASTGTRELPAGNATEAIEPLSAVGLLPETTYDYALVASNEAGIVTGEPETFTTGAATPPIVTTGGASGVTLSTATISGTVGTRGLDVGYAFEVSTEPNNPGPPSGGGSIGAGIVEEGVSVALQGLQPGTTYYYKLLATSTDGTEEGKLLSFTTPGFTSPLVQPATPVLVGTPNVAFPSGSQENTGAGETKPLTKAQKLKAALKVCKKEKPKAKRVKCEKSAHKKFGPAKKSKKR